MNEKKKNGIHYTLSYVDRIYTFIYFVKKGCNYPARIRQGKNIFEIIEYYK